MEAYVIVFFATWLMAGFLNGVCGLGGALVAVPITAAFLPPTILTPVTGIIATSVCAHLAWIYRANIRYSSLKSLLIGAVPGGIAGVSLLVFVEPQYIQLLTGISMIFFMVGQIVSKAPDGIHPPETLSKNMFAGFIAGLLSASIGISNPPVGAYALHLGWAQAPTIGTINIFSVIAYVLASGMQASSGLFNAEVIKLASMGVVAAMIGSFCSIPVAKMLPVNTFRSILRIIIIFGGVVCMWRGIAAL